jgi:outer membrane protein OmpA-like peptidoglycan-associated protein
VRVLSAAGASLLILMSWSSAICAAPVRLHGSGAAARALDEFQKDEFGWGLSGLGAVELGITRALGLELELSGLWLSDADDPVDPTILPADYATSFAGALGLRVRPFASKYAGRPIGPAGLWVAAHAGVARTGGLTRPMVDAQVGFDLLYRQGRVGVGPMLGYMQVFQPDDEFRPEDANILLLGVHAMFDTATPARVDGDADNDGIRDSEDRCARDPEDRDAFQDQDGCPEPDNDHDGILDTRDACPNNPEDRDGFEDHDGCPELDNDKDGLVDTKDKCPNDPEDKDGFEDEDGCPDEDNDQDGILDATDLCPNEPETKNNYADQDGCPDEQQVRVLGDNIVLDDRVHFRTNNAMIRIISYPLLERLAKLINDHPEYVHIDIEGHADERGPESFNQKLSEDRANSVLEFLVKHGVARERLSAAGFGTTRPIAPKRSEYSWLLNRRVEFRVTRELKYTGPTAPQLQTPKGPAAEGVSDLPAAQDDEKIPNAEDSGDPERKGGPASKPEPKTPPKPQAPKAPQTPPKQNPQGGAR